MVSRHPYKELPDYAFWSRSVSRVSSGDVDPVTTSPRFIERHHLIATAGSCFAQHLARRLRQSGYSYYVAENIHPVLNDDVGKEQNYGLFSARYGNIYTARQLLQLYKRAFQDFRPVDDHWNTTGVFVDPLRPTTQPGGYRTLAELVRDRDYHLSCVREMFQKLDFFIFTLGLTEAWLNSEDGTVYPICPGVVDGRFDSGKHVFCNFSYDDVLDDMRDFLRLLSNINPKAKVILTVSPVPLVATKEDRHVLVSTTYSKSVLRVVCDTLTRQFENVHYFPSYEIITGPHARGRYYGEDLREIDEAGVDHVMRVFARHFLSQSPAEELPKVPPTAVPGATSVQQIAQQFVEVECDEARLEKRE
ncbi:GSCFA domain-containing protein [Ciceribacter thiooxidans]|uniref:GSCFA domain-containing protein n=1 Tax=Ciceribacter thiooxidans TaxID=1969821 RepID=A0ABV7I580_9HYPH|nr:GSCFA domain-containing protein [Ciceribacter thiooxidans]